MLFCAPLFVVINKELEWMKGEYGGEDKEIILP
jgi:hypothetical protein